MPVGELKAQCTESTLRPIHNARLVDVNFPDWQAASARISWRGVLCGLGARHGLRDGDPAWGDEAQTFSREAECSPGLAHNV